MTSNPQPNRKMIVCVVAALCCAFGCIDYVLGWQDASLGSDAKFFGKKAGIDSTGERLRSDFATFYYAAKGAAVGINIYNARALDSLATRDGVETHVLPYLYPPLFAIAARPLAALSPPVAQSVWTIVSVCSFCLIVVLTILTPSYEVPFDARYWIVGGAAAVVLFFVLPFRNNLHFGQINFLVLVCISAGLFFFFNGKSDWASGAFLALAVLIKVTPVLLLLPLALVRRPQVLFGFTLGIVGFIGVTVLQAGTELWYRFLEFLPNMGYARNVEGGFHPSIVANFSLAGFLMRVFVGEGQLIRIVTMIGGVLLFAFLLYPTLKRRIVLGVSTLLLPYLVLMIVVSPVAWLPHLIFLFPGAVITLRHLWFSKNEKTRWRWMAAALLTFFFASLDFQPLYALAIPESARPFVTSMNLHFLLLMFFGSVALGRTS